MSNNDIPITTVTTVTNVSNVTNVTRTTTLTLEQENKKLKKKIKKYETLMKHLMDNSDSESEDLNNNQLHIIEEKEKDGTTHMMVETKLGDAFVIINSGKDLKELNQNEYNIIKCQDDLHNYDKSCNYYKKIGTAWGWTTFVAGLGRLAFGLL